MTPASDWVDYALDQRTVVDQGGMTKFRTHTPIPGPNGRTQWFQTNDPNANSNGVIAGNCTERTPSSTAMPADEAIALIYCLMTEPSRLRTSPQPPFNCCRSPRSL
jgi:hypothetical protein